MSEQNTTLNKKIGCRVRELRKKRKIKALDLYFKLYESSRGSIKDNTAIHYISDRETCKDGRHFSIEELVKLTHIFNVDLEFLACMQDEEVRGMEAIGKITGLSDESVNTLKLLKDLSDRVKAGETVNYGKEYDTLEMFDTLLSSSTTFLDVLSSMGRYIYCIDDEEILEVTVGKNKTASLIKGTDPKTFIRLLEVNSIMDSLDYLKDELRRSKDDN